MSKRFTDTEKWRDEWWGSLSNDYRMIWLYLVDSCSFAGLWKKDFRGLNFNCNTNISEDEFLKMFGNRVIDKGGFFFIPKFVFFQYPKGLNSNKPAIISVVKELTKNNLLIIINELFGNDYLIIKDKDMVKDKDTVKEKDKVKDKKEGSKKNVFIKPLPSEILEFFVSLGFDSVLSNKFYNHYESNGWLVGKNKMKDWKAAARNWASKEPKPTKNGDSIPFELKSQSGKAMQILENLNG